MKNPTVLGFDAMMKHSKYAFTVTGQARLSVPVSAPREAENHQSMQEENKSLLIFCFARCFCLDWGFALHAAFVLDGHRLC